MPAKGKPARTSERELVTTYIFDAPRALVWKAWTDPKLIPRWWGPKRYTTTVEKMEVRPGGTWRFIQRDSEGNVYGFHGEYKEVVPPERIVDTFEYEGMPGHVLIESATFEEIHARPMGGSGSRRSVAVRHARPRGEGLLGHRGLSRNRPREANRLHGQLRGRERKRRSGDVLRNEPGDPAGDARHDNLRRRGRRDEGDLATCRDACGARARRGDAGLERDVRQARHEIAAVMSERKNSPGRRGGRPACETIYPKGRNRPARFSGGESECVGTSRPCS